MVMRRAYVGDVGVGVVWCGGEVLLFQLQEKQISSTGA